jgi:hypothetical protein
MCSFSINVEKIYENVKKRFFFPHGIALVYAIDHVLPYLAAV